MPLLEYEREIRDLVDRLQLIISSAVIESGEQVEDLMNQIVTNAPRRLDFADRSSVLLSSGERIVSKMDTIADDVLRRVGPISLNVEKMLKSFEVNFLEIGRQIPTVGLRQEVLRALDDLVRDLLRSVGREIFARVRRTLQLGTLASPGPGFDASAAINAALRRKAWVKRVHSIVQTEVPRFHGLMMSRVLAELNTTIPVAKAWIWSQVQRAEHAAIDGQIRPLDGFFDVPIRPRSGGGSVKMRYPRDERVMVPSAVINCQCVYIGIPVGELPAGVRL